MKTFNDAQRTQIELAKTITSFKETLLSFAHYNNEDMNEDTRRVLTNLFLMDALKNAEDDLTAFMKEDINNG